jgi:predicted protein tyrosine phosphatase
MYYVYVIIRRMMIYFYNKLSLFSQTRFLNISIFNKNTYYNHLITNKRNINIENEKRINKNKYNKVMYQIQNQNNYINWVYNNNINNLKNYRVIILDFNRVYDYDKKQLINVELLKYLSKFCYLHKIIFVIISELHPNYFPNIKYFNQTNNLITPYHYKTKSFGGVQKLELNKLNERSVNVSINKLILDIMNQYGIMNDEYIYISNENVDNINIFNL